MQKLKNKIQEPEKIIIEAELAVPLGELEIYTLPKMEGAKSIIELLNKKPFIANCILEKIARQIIKKKKMEVKIKKMEFDYCDDDRIERGTAYFNVRLKGTEKQLRKIAGENRVCFFDWEEGIKFNAKNNSIINPI